MASDDQDDINKMKSSFETTDTSLAANQKELNKSPNVIDLDGIDDEDPIALNKDDLKDGDYEQSSRQTRQRTNQSKSKYDKLSKQALITSLTARDNEVVELKKKKTEVNQEAQKERKSRIQLQSEMRQLRQENNDLRVNLRRSQEEKDGQKEIFKAEVETIEEKFAKAERDWTAKIKNSIYPSLPDNIVRDKFQELWNNCREWVKNWYQGQITELSVQFFENVALGCVSDQRSSGKDLLLTKLKSRSPLTVMRALGFAWLSRTMIHFFLKSPFFAFGQNQGALERFYDRSKQGKHDSLIHSTLTSFAGDPKKACAWRAETLRLFREDQGVRPLQLKGDSLTSKGLKRLCTGMVDKLTSGNVAVVLREVTDEELERRQTELNDICRGFCLLALELWSQKSQLALVDDATLFGTGFSMNSILHQPHRSMGMDEDDTKFDGDLPHAVLVPALRIFGDANGDNLETEKIISRSFVFIFDEAPSTAVKPPASRMVPLLSERSESPAVASALVDSGGSKKRKRALTESPLADLGASSQDAIQPRTEGAQKRVSREGDDSRFNGFLRQTEPRELVALDDSQSGPIVQKTKGDLQDSAFESLTQQLHKAMNDPQTPSTSTTSSHRWMPDSTFLEGTSHEIYWYANVEENEERKVAIFH